MNLLRLKKISFGTFRNTITQAAIITGFIFGLVYTGYRLSTNHLDAIFGPVSISGYTGLVVQFLLDWLLIIACGFVGSFIFFFPYKLVLLITKGFKVRAVYEEVQEPGQTDSGAAPQSNGQSN